LGDLYLLSILNCPLLWWHNWRFLPPMKDEALAPVAFLVEKLPTATPADELRHTTEEQARHSDINLTMNTHTQLVIPELAGDVEALPPVPGKKPPWR